MIFVDTGVWYSLLVPTELSEDQFHRSWLLFQKLSSAGLSFTDCTSHVVAVDLGIRTIASFDHHFQTTGRFQVVP
jgi:predicted nucleic acid-binding protein